MPAASCDRCGWQQDYATRQGKSLGVKRHQARGCGPTRRGDPVKAAATMAALEGGRWRAMTELAGYPAERTVEEWVTHPFALDDLLRVLGGTRLEKIAAERTKMRRRSA